MFVYFKQVTVKGNESVLISKSFFCQQVYLKTFEYHEKVKVLDLLGLCSFGDPKSTDTINNRLSTVCIHRITTLIFINFKQLRHENLVNLLEVWKRRRRWYLVFEFVERTLLDDLEQNPSGLEINTCRQYLYQILRAAAFCHQQNVRTYD